MTEPVPAPVIDNACCTAARAHRARPYSGLLVAFGLWFCLLSLTALAGPALARASPFDHGVWDGLLQRHVQPIGGGRSTEVDYAGMARERDQLKAYLDALAAVPESDFRRWAEDERLAFLINAYNAWTVELVLSAWPELDSIKDLGSLLESPWKRRFIPLFGRTRSLDDIEHGMIRAKGTYDEPRIHFAVNCASIGCPALRTEAYTAAALDAQLSDATRGFLGDRTRNRVADARLEISSIFKWYGKDFDRVGGLRGFLADQGDALGLTAEQLRALQAGALEITFLEYDWRLNGTR
jgi:hypothetical protein